MKRAISQLAGTSGHEVGIDGVDRDEVGDELAQRHQTPPRATRDRLAVDAARPRAAEEGDHLGHLLGSEHASLRVARRALGPDLVRLDAALGGGRPRGALRHLRAHPARADGVARHAVRRRVDRDRAREADQRVLGRAVGGLARPRALARGGAHVDDAAPAGADHVGQHEPGELERRVQVDGVRRVPRLGVDLPGRRVVGRADAGVVDEDLHGPELAGRGHGRRGSPPGRRARRRRRARRTRRAGARAPRRCGRRRRRARHRG